MLNVSDNEILLFKHEVEEFNKIETEIKNLKSPTWEEILNRDYHSWVDDRLLIDTAGKKVSESVDELMHKLKLSERRSF